MVSHKNYNLNVNEDFIFFLTSKLITCFIDGFISKMKTKSIVYLLIGSAHIYWIIDLEGEVHSIWDLYSIGLQECKGNVSFEVWRGGQQFSIGYKTFLGGLPQPESNTPESLCRGVYCPPLWQHPSSSLVEIVWKVMGQHLFLNLIPNNFTTRTGRKVWSDPSMSKQASRMSKRVRCA
jgi:hypothetical protein